MIEVRHYKTKFINSKCFKKFEQSSCYKSTGKNYQKMRKELKIKMQGEFYVDSDPEHEEIKGKDNSKLDESNIDIPVIEG
jgi:hypothetical protein